MSADSELAYTTGPGPGPGPAGVTVTGVTGYCGTRAAGRRGPC
jgi:hypothetical protein